MFPTEHCWTGVHLVHASFAIIVASIFIAICLIVSLTFFDSNSNSHDISSRINSRADLFVIVMKIILTLMYQFFASTDY